MHRGDEVDALAEGREEPCARGLRVVAEVAARDRGEASGARGVHPLALAREQRNDRAREPLLLPGDDLRLQRQRERLRALLPARPDRARDDFEEHVDRAGCVRVRAQDLLEREAAVVVERRRLGADLRQQAIDRRGRVRPRGGRAHRFELRSRRRHPQRREHGVEGVLRREGAREQGEEGEQARHRRTYVARWGSVKEACAIPWHSRRALRHGCRRPASWP
ncbi:MAG TPA: hypothetical protein VK081_08380 [Planctomycetota bacterium]|nr:hypothetical protein [Planctomycetota bacterium]